MATSPTSLVNTVPKPMTVKELSDGLETFADSLAKQEVPADFQEQETPSPAFKILNEAGAIANGDQNEKTYLSVRLERLARALAKPQDKDAANAVQEDLPRTITYIAKAIKSFGDPSRPVAKVAA